MLPSASVEVAAQLPAVEAHGFVCVRYGTPDSTSTTDCRSRKQCTLPSASVEVVALHTATATLTEVEAEDIVEAAVAAAVAEVSVSVMMARAACD